MLPWQHSHWQHTQVHGQSMYLSETDNTHRSYAYETHLWPSSHTTQLHTTVTYHTQSLVLEWYTCPLKAAGLFSHATVGIVNVWFTWGHGLSLNGSGPLVPYIAVVGEGQAYKCICTWCIRNRKDDNVITRVVLASFPYLVFLPTCWFHQSIPLLPFEVWWFPWATGREYPPASFHLPSSSIPISYLSVNHLVPTGGQGTYFLFWPPCWGWQLNPSISRHRHAIV